MIAISPEFRKVAERVIWFESAEDALRYPTRFLAYLMTFGTLEEVLIARKFFTKEDFRSALVDAPPGIFDVRSWTYWNGVYGRHPIPPLPQRSLEP
jgi:hypothetical protein